MTTQDTGFIVSAEKLATIKREARRYFPCDGWTDQDFIDHFRSVAYPGGAFYEAVRRGWTGDRS